MDNEKLLQNWPDYFEFLLHAFPHFLELLYALLKFVWILNAKLPLRRLRAKLITKRSSL